MIASETPQKLVIRSGDHSATRFVRTTRDGVSQGNSTLTVTVLSDDTSYAISPNLGSAEATVTDPPPPMHQIIRLPAGEFVQVVWQGATTLPANVPAYGHPDDVEVSDRFSIYYWVAAEMTWLVSFYGAPDIVNSLDYVYNGRTYTIVSRDADNTLRVPIASGASSSSSEGDAASAPDSGWVATVTCESGLSPGRLGTAPTEAEAVTAATWFIDSPSGCGGAGSYTIAAPTQDGG